MNKIFLILLIIIGVLLIACAGVYFCARFYLISLGPEYFFAHPTTGRVFNVSLACPNNENLVCGKDQKTYKNKCIALQNKAGYAHDGQCFEAYKNETYGFQLDIPNSWKGYYVQKSKWQGVGIDGEAKGKNYSGIQLTFMNPKTTAEQKWQDIPIMVFTPDVWNLVAQEKISVGAAPIGPAKIGENAKYVFATPPRWYGFTDAVGFEEAVNIVKTFKAY